MPTVPFSTPRVNQAPIANTESQSRATGADFGSQTAGAFGDLGGSVTQSANLRDQKVKEDEQRFTMEAFNQYQVEAGQAQIDYNNLKGMDVTPEARDKYLQDVKNAATKYRADLSPRAQRLYDQEIGRDHVAKTLDAQAHFTRQGDVATEEARKATYTLAANSAAANYGTEQGAQDQRRMLGTIDAQKGITPEESERQKINAMSGLAADVVDRHIKAGDLTGAQKAFDDLRSTQLVSSDAETQISGQLEHATQRQRDGVYVDQVMAGLNKDIPAYDFPDLDHQQQAFYKTLDDQKESGELSQDEYDRRRARGEAQFVDVNRHMREVHAEQATAWGTRMDNVGNLSGAMLIADDAATKPETQWLVKGLREKAITKYGTEAEKAARDQAHEDRDPQWRAKSMQTIMDVINAGKFQTPEEMQSRAFSLGLGKADVDTLAAAYTGKGAVNGIKQDDVLEAILDPKVKKQYKDDPAGLLELWKYVANGADPKKRYTPDEMAKAVSNARWAGIVGNQEDTVKVFRDGKLVTVPVTAATAAEAGRDAEFIPNFTDEHTLKGIHDEMALRYQQTGDENFNPDRTTKSIAAHDTILRDDLQFGDPNANSLPGYPNASLIEASPQGWVQHDPAYTTQGAEKNPDAAERAYLQRVYLGTTPGQSRVAARQEQATTAVANLAALEKQRANRLAANRDLSKFLDTASFGPKGSGFHGEEAANLQLEQSLKNGEVPTWLEQYVQQRHGVSLGAKVEGTGLVQDAKRAAQRVLARTAYYDAIKDLH